MVLQTGERFRDATDEEVLKVLPDCTREEIQKSYDHLISLYHPLYYSADRFNDIKDRLKSIIDRLTSAYDNLTSKIDFRLPLSQTPLDEASPLAHQRPEPLQTQELPKQQPSAVAHPVEEEWSIAELQDRLKKDPGNVVLMRKMGKKLQESGKAQEAEKHLLRALELEPQNVENHLALAHLYQGLGLRMKAFKHFNIVLQMQPENERVLEALGLKKKKKPLYEISSDE